MYWSAYFVTEGRAKVSDYTIPMAETGMVVVTMKEKEEHWTDRLKQPLAPFSSDLWLTILGMVVYVSGIFWLLDGGLGEYDVERKLRESVLRGSAVDDTTVPVEGLSLRGLRLLTWLDP